MVTGTTTSMSCNNKASIFIVLFEPKTAEYPYPLYFIIKFVVFYIELVPERMFWTFVHDLLIKKRKNVSYFHCFLNGIVWYIKTNNMAVTTCNCNHIMTLQHTEKEFMKEDESSKNIEKINRTLNSFLVLHIGKISIHFHQCMLII